MIFHARYCEIVQRKDGGSEKCRIVECGRVLESYLHAVRCRHRCTGPSHFKIFSAKKIRYFQTKIVRRRGQLSIISSSVCARRVQSVILPSVLRILDGLLPSWRRHQVLALWTGYCSWYCAISNVTFQLHSNEGTRVFQPCQTNVYKCRDSTTPSMAAGRRTLRVDRGHENLDSIQRKVSLEIFETFFRKIFCRSDRKTNGGGAPVAQQLMLPYFSSATNHSLYDFCSQVMRENIPIGQETLILNDSTQYIVAVLLDTYKNVKIICRSKTYPAYFPLPSMEPGHFLSLVDVDSLAEGGVVAQKAILRDMEIKERLSTAQGSPVVLVYPSTSTGTQLPAQPTPLSLLNAIDYRHEPAFSWCVFFVWKFSVWCLFYSQQESTSCCMLAYLKRCFQFSAAELKSHF